MKAVLIKEFGGPEQLYLGTCETPQPKANEILVKVAATALNRADTLQRMGKYPAPKGESEILGLEIAGTVESVGAKVTKWKVGDRVCGLLGGGGYASYAVIHEELAMPIPDGISLIEAAAIPEVFLTAFQAIQWIAQLKEGEHILIHAGASGVGTAAIQLANRMGAIPIVTASSAKHELCLELGARHAIDYKTENFEESVIKLTDGKGANVIVDFIGAPYMQQNLNALAMDGRMVMLAFLGTPKIEALNLIPILRKRLQINGSTLRARSLDYKVELSQDLMRFAWPLFTDGRLKAVVDSVFDWEDVADAHRYMEANKNKGKIILKVS